MTFSHESSVLNNEFYSQHPSHSRTEMFGTILELSGNVIYVHIRILEITTDSTLDIF